MLRWTSSAREVEHLAQLHEEFLPAGQVTVMMNSGAIVNGFVTGANFGRDPNIPGAYYAGFNLEIANGSVLEIDYLDIAHAENCRSRE